MFRIVEEKITRNVELVLKEAKKRKLPLRDVQRDAVERDDFVVTLPVNFSNVDATDHAVRCSGNAHEQRDIERCACFASLLDGLELG